MKRGLNETTSPDEERPSKKKAKKKKDASGEKSERRSKKRDKKEKHHSAGAIPLSHPTTAAVIEHVAGEAGASREKLAAALKEAQERMRQVEYELQTTQVTCLRACPSSRGVAVLSLRWCPHAWYLDRH